MAGRFRLEERIAGLPNKVRSSYKRGYFARGVQGGGGFGRFGRSFWVCSLFGSSWPLQRLYRLHRDKRGKCFAQAARYLRLVPLVRAVRVRRHFASFLRPAAVNLCRNARSTCFTGGFVDGYATDRGWKGLQRSEPSANLPPVDPALPSGPVVLRGILTIRRI